MRRLAVVIAVWSTLLGAAGDAQALPKQPVFSITGPTVLAFAPPLTKKQLERDLDLNEVLADFQVYARRVREPLSKLGIEFKEVYARSFRVRADGKIVTFRPAAKPVGYYFVAPGSGSYVEYGVNTDEGILGIATRHFGIPIEWEEGDLVSTARNGNFYEYRIMAGLDRFTGRSTRLLHLNPGRRVKFSIAGQKLHLFDDDGVRQELQYWMHEAMPPPPAPRTPPNSPRSLGR